MARAAKLAYLPGLDGLRALAVIAVVVYHADPHWLPGGFLGVEVFFVISGYIITCGLLAGWRETGRVDPLSFWSRRALRLLPAVFALLGFLLLASALFMPEKLDALRPDTVAAMLYVTNWKLIYGHVPYFETFGPPPLLQHLWSLAVEEQFYIVWPLVLAVLLRVFKPRLAGGVVLLGALASAGLMSLLFSDVYNTTRIYYGTDTRACGLLLGAALAFAIRPGLSTRRFGAFALLLAGVAGLAGLTALSLHLTEYDPLLYNGGFLLTGIATAAVIASVAVPKSLTSRLIGVLPVRWIGVRSYGIYLWHWPLLQLLKPEDGFSHAGLALRLTLTLFAAILSYRFIETPARTGGIGRLMRSFTLPSPSTWSYRRSFGSIAGAVGLVAFSVAVAAVNAPTAKASRSSSVLIPLIVYPQSSDLLASGAEAEETLAPAAPAPEPEPPAAEPEPPPAPAPPPPPPPPPLPVVGTAPIPAGLKIIAVGDSVMLGASRQMAYVLGTSSVDAEVGRQVSTAIEVLRNDLAAAGTPDIVVVGLGSNGGFTSRQFDQLMDQLANVKLVIFVNVSVPRAWEESNNRVIGNGVAAYPNTVLVDWRQATEGHGELFGEDRVHLTGSGIRLYAGLVADAIVGNWK